MGWGLPIIIGLGWIDPQVQSDIYMNLHDPLKATKRAFRGSLHLYQERE